MSVWEILLPIREVKSVGKATRGQWFNKPDTKLDLKKDCIKIIQGFESLFHHFNAFFKTNFALCIERMFCLIGPGQSAQTAHKIGVEGEDLKYFSKSKNTFFRKKSGTLVQKVEKSLANTALKQKSSQPPFGLNWKAQSGSRAEPKFDYITLVI